MKQGHDELVQFIRRTFGAATIAIIAVAAIFMALFYRRSATHALDPVIVGSATVSLVVVLAALYLLRRRLTTQAQDLAINAAALDLRNAQLIDQTVQMERQQSELEQQAVRLRDALGELESQKADLQIRSVELQQIVNALQASESRFRTLVDSLHDVVYTLGLDLRYSGMYGGTSSPEGPDLAVYIGKTAVEILGPELGCVHTEAGERALRGESVTFDWSMPVDGTMRHFTATNSPLRGPRGEITGVVGINRECTDQVQRDKALSEARDQLRQAQRLDALGQLAGGVAHDFNNLLTVIMTYAAILLEDAVPGTDEARSVEEIRDASERAAALTRQLLAFSRRQVLQPRAIDLNETVTEVEKMLRRVLPPDVEVDTMLAPDLGLVMADPGQIEQVLVNLAINARDAMPDGGRLTISTANVDLDGAYADADVDLRAMTGPHVVITVADTGIGMSPEVVSKAFDPFFTTKDVGKGTGLGLATVHGIIEQSGGRVRIYSEVGRGSTFRIYLPRFIAAAEATPSPIHGAHELSGTESVLLIDDNEELRRVVKRMLTRAGYHVLEAANGAAALAQLDRGVHVDLVVSDVMMPELGGRAVVDAVRQRHKSVKLLLMSGYNYDTALRGMAQRGDVAFIEKPFTAEKLLRKLRAVLGRAPDRGAA
jgi:two-component system cell cycle sensor histidine kinase/response regulator CckA